MLKHNESELLSAYLDNQLNNDEREHVSRSLAAYVEWREELQRLRRAKTLVATLPRVMAPSDLKLLLEKQAIQATTPVPLMARIKEALSIFDMSRRMVWASSMASVVLAISLFVGIRQYSKPQPLPLSALMAAHNRGSNAANFTPYVFSSSSYSRQIKLVNDNHV